MGRVMVIPETEGMPSLEPTVVEMTAIGGATKGEGHGGEVKGRK